MNVIFWILFYCYLSLVNGHTQLNVPRILLPYNHDEYPSNFTLKVNNGGCYKWLSTREEVHLDEIFSNNGCSKEAIVSAITRSSSRLTAIIIAKDIETGVSLRCDVIVDSIKRIEIFTTTKELYVEEAPEEFVMRAYDKYDNEFTTLEGMKFHWDLQTVTDHKAVVHAQSVLRFITYESSPYTIRKGIGPIESRGEQGYTVLVEGKQTGQAKLSGRIAHDAYKRVPAYYVDLMVIANLILEPQDAYILADTTVQYSVWHLTQGLLNPVEVSESQFYLQVSDASIGKLEHNGIHVTGLTQGSTQVILRDINVKASDTLKQPTANLHVVEPSYLTIAIHPHNNPSLVVDHDYQFSINIYDKSNHLIMITDNIRVQTKLSDEFFTTEMMTENGTYASARPHTIGKTKITAKLASIVTEDDVIHFNPPLTAYQDLEILQKIHVTPSLVVLPWDPLSLPTYKVNLTVDHYQDSVIWSSSETDLVSVNRIGFCTTNGKGTAIVTAALSQNPDNKDSAKIVVKEALSLQLLDSEVEVEVNQKLLLPISLSTTFEDSRVFFSSCLQLPFEVESEQSAFVVLSSNQESEKEKGCVSLELMAKRKGFSKLKAFYSTSSAKLEGETTLGAFHPLMVSNPLSKVTVLALKTSRKITFEGGPLPWIKKPSSHYVQVRSSSEDLEVVLLEPNSSINQVDRYDIFVECLGQGNFTVTLSVGNKPSSTLPFPKNVSCSVSVICAVPDSLQLQSLLDVSSLSACPFLHGQDLIIAHCGTRVPLEVQLLDSEGRKFDNISSYALEWTLLDEKFGKLLEHNTEVRNVQPIGLEGDVVVTVELSGYKTLSLQEEPVNHLKDSITIRFVEEAKLLPSQLVLFNHQEIAEELSISGGSRYFELINLEIQSVVKIDFKSDKATIKVSPLSDGNITVTVRDLCLSSSNLITSDIRVSSVVSLELVTSERVQVGSTIKAEVIVRDAFHNIIPAYSLMKITPHPLNDLISVSYEGTNKARNAVLAVKGISTGLSSLKVSSSQANSVIISPRKSIQVFDPLTIMPRNITLLVGSNYQVETQGGPHADCLVEYWIENDLIATTSSSGVVTARTLGSTTLLAKSVVTTQNEQRLVVSQDMIVITVIPMESIRIHAPLRHIEVGASMPLYVIGTDQLTPSGYAVADPPLSFEWRLSYGSNAQIVTPYEENGINEGSLNVGHVRFEALNPGRVTVTVKVKVTVVQPSDSFQILKNVVITDEIELRIFNSLKLKQPLTDDAKILLSPKARTTLVTNKGKDGVIYTSKCGSSPPLVDVSEGGVVTAKSDVGETSLMVKVEHPFGVTQNLVLLAEVRPIKYLQVIPEVFLKTEEFGDLSGVPLGTSHVLNFQFHDDRGRIFTNTNSQVRYRLSRFDRVNVHGGPGNNSVTMTVRDVGQTVIFFWLEDNPSVNDYLRVISAPGIYPHKSSSHLGNSVCFTSHLRGRKGQKGVWRSDDSGFHIDSQSGVGFGRLIGKYQIHYDVADVTTTTTQIQVFPITEVILDVTNVHVSNYVTPDGWFVPVTLRSNEGSDSSSCSSSPSSVFTPEDPPLFKCFLSFDNDSSLQTHSLFKVTSSYVPQKGFGCLIESLSGPEASLLFMESDLRVEVVVALRGQQPEVRSNIGVLPFSPAVVANKEKLSISADNPTQEFLLLGQKSILNSFIVLEEIGVTLEMNEAEDKLRRCSVSLLDSYTSESRVILLSSTLTHQVIEIKIDQGDGDFEKCVSSDMPKGLFGVALRFAAIYRSPLVLAIVIFVTISALYLGYQFLTHPGYKQTQDTSVFASSPSPSEPPVTPLRPNRTVTMHSLWSDNTAPVYGMPIIRSSPRPAYDNSPTYS